MESHESDHAPDLDWVERRLRAERPAPTALELDGIKREIYVRASRRSAREPRRLQFMRSRMAITMMLVLGLLLSTSGVGLAISGSSGSGSASSAQYKPETQGNQQIGPTNAPAAPTNVQTHHVVSSAPSKGTPEAAASAPAAAQVSQQVVATQSAPSGQLPFTGFNAIPVLLGGLALLTMGLVLRWRTRHERG